jgi:hypothetical protein
VLVSVLGGSPIMIEIVRLAVEPLVTITSEGTLANAGTVKKASAILVMIVE